MFKKFFDELMNAKTEEEINDILYRTDGVDRSFQREKITYQDLERLFCLAERLAKTLVDKV